MINRIPIIEGKKNFQVSIINWSYRNRGRAARAHKNINMKIDDFSHNERSRSIINRE